MHPPTRPPFTHKFNLLSGDRAGMSNCFSLRHTSSYNELILSCGDGDQSTVLYKQWVDALVDGIESQGGCPLQQQKDEEREQGNCLWKGWTYKKGDINTAWKKRFIRLTAASVTFVEQAHKITEMRYHVIP